MSCKLFLMILTIGVIIIKFKFTKVHPDFGLNVIQLIEKYGYPVERHENIQTPDGYLLELHRIPHGKHNGNLTNKPVVLLMHSFLCSSAEWIYTGPTKSLACILADAGFDVWLGNYRGNTWSRKHIKYNPSEEKFWNFSLHEHGVYDVPTIIDYALMNTNQTSLYYIGHSQGSLTFFVMASEIPEYNMKIRFMAALGPVTYLTNSKSPVLLFFKKSYKLIVKFGIYEFMPHTNISQYIGQLFCNEYAPTVKLCPYVMFVIAGFHFEQLTEGLVPLIASHTPAGSSLKVWSHFLQLTKSPHFGPFDYGPVGNLVEYQTTEVPQYNLSQVTTSVGLFYASNDWLSSVTDVHRLREGLGNVVFDYLVADEKFNHFDFYWAKDVVSLVYEKVIDVMKKY